MLSWHPSNYLRKVVLFSTLYATIIVKKGYYIERGGDNVHVGSDLLGLVDIETWELVH